MKIDRSELSKKIGQLKGVVPKNATSEALQGVLVKDGYLIASNTELTVKAKLEGIEDECFIIPSKAFDLISNLPAGEVNVTHDGSDVTIQMGKIKNKFKTHPVEKFLYNRESIETVGQASIAAEDMKKAITHTLYATSASGANQMMNGLCLSAKEGKLNFVGLDGHRIAFDSIPFDGEFKLIIPRAAMEKVLQLDLQGDIQISYDKLGALFKTEDYEIYTRLIDGTYFPYEKMMAEGNINTAVTRKLFLEAVNRAKLCGALEDKAPVVLTITNSTMDIVYKNNLADYQEEIPIQVDVGEGLKIAFDPKLLIECLKAFECENVSLAFSSNNMPGKVMAEDSDMAAVILPCGIRG